MPDTQQLHADMDAARLRLESELTASVREVAAASVRLTLAHERLARHEMQVEMTVRAIEHSRGLSKGSGKSAVITESVLAKLRAEEAIFNAD